MSFMDELILKHHIFLQVVGSIMLLAFGIYTFRSNPVKSLRPSSGTRGTYLHNFVTAFFVTLSNPLIIFLFIGLFARFSFVMPGSPIGFQLVGYLAIILGALGWWFSITVIRESSWPLPVNLFLDRICIFLNNLKKRISPNTCCICGRWKT